MDVTYLAISFGYWGRGDTEVDAIKELRKAGGGRKADKTCVYRNEREAGKDKPYVDDYGNTCYFGTLTKVAEIINGKRAECVS